MMYPHLSARLFNAPLLLHPQKLDAIIAGIGPRLLGGKSLQLDAISAQAPEMFSTRKTTRADMERGFKVVDGVAVVSAMGALVHRTRMEADSTMLIGYNDLAATAEAAMDNPEVHAILQVYDSPGGEVAGAFEYGQRLLDMRGKKPMIAIADSMAASAAYLAASAADEVVLTATGYVGSVGVVMRHVDFSKALENDGIQVTHIFAGAHKVDGNPYEPLPTDVRASFQEDIESLYAMFVQAVSTHTGLSTEAVRATQARTYRGQTAIDVGLARRISTTDALIAELASQRTRIYPVSSPQAKAMTTTTAPTAVQPAAPATNVAAASAVAAAFSQADIDAAHAAGASAERARVSAILGHERATSNMSTAVQCINAGLSAEQAGAILGSLPTAITTTVASINTGFAVAMAAVPNPTVSGIESANADSSPEASATALAAQIVSGFTAAAR
ncbi:MAG: S49 family peptidase [Burkholderiaceae bacterium]|nr:S49 family peptidase [Burkholderiaceae bacterium]